MKSVSTLAIAAAFVLAGANVLPAPAAAQPQQPMAPTQQQRTFTLSAAERAALQPLQAALDANNFAAAQGALPAARAGAQSSDGRYVLGQLMLRLGLGTQNVPLQSEAIDTLIASGGAGASELPRLYDAQATLAMTSGSRDRTEAALNRLVESSPNDPTALVRLAQFRYDQRRPQEALALTERAIALAQSMGRPAPETWYTYALRLAFDNRMAPQSLALGRGLVSNYPSPRNWRDALLAYRDLSQFDDAMRLDHFRLMRATGAFAGERDFFEAATLLQQRGHSGEAAALLQEGVAERQISASEGAFRDLIATTGRGATQGRAALTASQRDARASTQGSAALAAADALYGHGRYAEAAELYRAALQRGGAGVDANVVNTRLGAALAMAGQRAEAEAALRAVTGPREPLAQFWLAWLARRPA